MLLFVSTSPKLPFRLFEPLFVITFTSTEPFRPYSAEKLFTATRTSWTLSLFGLMFTMPLRWLELTVEESTRKLFDSARAPLAFMFTPNSLL